MSPETRKSLGKAARTAEEVVRDVEIKAEKELHGLISADLHSRRIKFIHAKMSKKSPLPEGWPDYTILVPGGHLLFMEVKTQTGKLSSIQTACINSLNEDGYRVFVPRSFDEYRLILSDYLAANNNPANTQD